MSIASVLTSCWDVVVGLISWHLNLPIYLKILVGALYATGIIIWILKLKNT